MVSRQLSNAKIGRYTNKKTIQYRVLRDIHAFEGNFVNVIFLYRLKGLYHFVEFERRIFLTKKPLINFVKKLFQKKIVIEVIMIFQDGH